MKRHLDYRRTRRGFTLLEASLWVLAITGAAVGSHYLASTADHVSALEIAELDAGKMRLVSHLAADYWYLKPELDDSPDLAASLRWPANINALTAPGSTVILGNRINSAYNLDWLRLGGRLEIQAYSNTPSDQYPHGAPAQNNTQSYLDVIASYPGNSHAQCRHAQYVGNALHAMGALQRENSLTSPSINWGSLVTVNCASANTTVTLRLPDPNMIVHPGFNRFPNAAPRFGWVASGNLDMNSFPLQGRGNQNINTGGTIEAGKTVNVNSLNGQVNAALDADVVTTIYVNNLELYQLNLAYNNFAENAEFTTFAGANICSGEILSDIVIANHARNSFCNSNGYNVDGDFRVTAASDNTYRPRTFGVTRIRSCPDNVELNGVSAVAIGGVDQFRNIGETCNGTADFSTLPDIETGVDQESFVGTWNIRDENGTILEIENHYTAPKIWLDTFETNAVFFPETLSIHFNSWRGRQQWKRFDVDNAGVAFWQNYWSNSISGFPGSSPWDWTTNEFFAIWRQRAGNVDLYHNATYQRFNSIFATPSFTNDGVVMTTRGCQYTKQIVDAGSDFNIDSAVALERIQAANIYDYEYVVGGAPRLGWLAAQAETAMPERATSINHAAGDLGFVEDDAGRELVWKALHEIQDRTDVLEQEVAERLDEFERLKQQLAAKRRRSQ